MTTVVLLLVYLWAEAPNRVVPKFDVTPVKSMDGCKLADEKRTAEIMKDGRFVQGLWAACSDVVMSAAKNG